MLPTVTVTYLDVDGVTLPKTHSELPNGIIGMSVKDIEIGDAFLVEKRPRYAAMEPASGHVTHPSVKVHAHHKPPHFA